MADKVSVGLFVLAIGLLFIAFPAITVAALISGLVGLDRWFWVLASSAVATPFIATVIGRLSQLIGD